MKHLLLLFVLNCGLTAQSSILTLATYWKVSYRTNGSTVDRIQDGLSTRNSAKPGGTPIVTFTLPTEPYPNANLLDGIWADYMRTAVSSYPQNGGVWQSPITINPVQPGQSLYFTFTIKTTGNPVVNWQSEASNTCSGPSAGAHVFMAGDTAYLDGDDFYGFYADDRWFAPAAIVPLTQAGTYQFTIPLLDSNSQPLGNWIEIFAVPNTDTTGAGNEPGYPLSGANVAQDWVKNMMPAIQSIGLAFGGGCSYGHGARVALNPDGTPTGTVTISIIDIEIK